MMSTLNAFSFCARVPASTMSSVSKGIQKATRRTTTRWVHRRGFASLGGGSDGAGGSGGHRCAGQDGNPTFGTVMPASAPSGEASMQSLFGNPFAGQAVPKLLTPLTGPSVWYGEDLKHCKNWGVELSPRDIDDLHNAVEMAKKAGAVQWCAEGVPEIIPKELFPLGPTMVTKIAKMSTELEDGKGLAMIRNMPINDSRFSEDDLAVVHLGLSAHIGHIILQSSSGLRSVSRGYGMPLGRVQAEMTGETPKGGKQTNNHFRLHTDRCDVISLMSIRTAPNGGASRVCSAPAVYNEMLKRCPELAQTLAEPIDRIWEGENGYFRLPVWGLTPSGKFTTQISPSYVENAQFLPNTQKASPAQIQGLDMIELLGMELGAEFIMKPGMLYFLNNHQVYHGRGNWEVTNEEMTGSWGKSGRLLTRTWISPYNSRVLPDTEQYRFVWGNVAGGAPRGGYDQALQTGEVPKPKMPEDHVYYSLFSSEVQQHSMHGQAGTVLEY